MDMTFVKLCSYWWTGQDWPTNAMLYGFSLMWWARLANIIQLIGGLFLVVEIVGYDWFLNQSSQAVDRHLKWGEAIASDRRRTFQWLGLLVERDGLVEEPEEIIDDIVHDDQGRLRKITYKPNPKFSEQENQRIRERRAIIDTELSNLVVNRVVRVIAILVGLVACAGWLLLWWGITQDHANYLGRPWGIFIFLGILPLYLPWSLGFFLGTLLATGVISVGIYVVSWTVHRSAGYMLRLMSGKRIILTSSVVIVSAGILLEILVTG